MIKLQINARELTAGLVLAALGAAVGIYAKANYELGTPADMGPGFFPMVLGWVLVALGLLVSLLSTQRTTTTRQSPGPKFKYLLTICVGILAFGLLLERLGLVPATVALTLFSTLLQRPYQPKKIALLASALSLGAWLIFVRGFGMPLVAFTFGG